MRTRWRVIAMALLALAGSGVAAYLVTVALDPNREVACGPLGDCHAVQSSQYADVAGVPVAAFGLLMYLGLAGLLLARLAGPLVGARDARVQEALATLTFSLALGGVVYSAYLTYLELAVIDAICAWCVTSAAIITALFALTLPDIASRRRTDSTQRRM